MHAFVIITEASKSTFIYIYTDFYLYFLQDILKFHMQTLRGERNIDMKYIHIGKHGMK